MQRRGFTLVELLLVTVVIAILSTLAVRRYMRVREKAYYASMIHDLDVLQNMQEIYYHDGGYVYKTSGTITAGVIDPDLNMEASSGVTITLSSHTAGWAATATHVAMPGQECNVFMGAAGTVGQATTAGQIACSG